LFADFCKIKNKHFQQRINLRFSKHLKVNKWTLTVAKYDNNMSGKFAVITDCFSIVLRYWHQTARLKSAASLTSGAKGPVTDFPCLEPVHGDSFSALTPLVEQQQGHVATAYTVLCISVTW